MALTRIRTHTCRKANTNTKEIQQENHQKKRQLSLGWDQDMYTRSRLLLLQFPTHLGLHLISHQDQVSLHTFNKPNCVSFIDNAILTYMGNNDFFTYTKFS